MVVRLTVRRFLCLTDDCTRVTFVERVSALAAPYARYTTTFVTAATAIAVELAGRAGARLAERLGMTVGRDTLLNLLRGLPDPPVGTVKVLGVDDFALRRGQNYGTVLVNMSTHRPVDVLPGREAEPLAAWLREHPGAEIICRDRAGAYAEGARSGAPNATQIADKWHLWHNVGQAVEKIVATHHSCLRAALASAEAPQQAPNEPAAEISPVSPEAVEVTGILDVLGNERRLVARTRERYEAVQEQLSRGASLGQICQRLQLDQGTVRRFARATSLEELLVKATNRESVLDDYTQVLLTSFHSGTTNAKILHAELQQLGYTGSIQTIRRFIHPLRSTEPPQAPPTVRPTVPKPRKIARWIMTDPAKLDSDDRTQLEELLGHCPELAATAGHVRDFADLMRKRQADRLHNWMKRVEADPLPPLHSLVTGLRRDLDAVLNGLKSAWSSGPVEGTVNRIILWN